MRESADRTLEEKREKLVDDLKKTIDNQVLTIATALENAYRLGWRDCRDEVKRLIDCYGDDSVDVRAKWLRGLLEKIEQARP